MGKGEVFGGFWLGGPKGRDHQEYLYVSGTVEPFKKKKWEDNIKMGLRETDRWGELDSASSR
jgi:hypothetical protein